MNVQPIQAVSNVPEPTQTEGQGKIAESCRQFEAGLWRSLLEKAMSPPKGSGGATESSGGAGKDTYQYFVVQTLADKVAGQPGGLASALQSQVTHSLPKPPPTSSSK